VAYRDRKAAHDAKQAEIREKRRREQEVISVEVAARLKASRHREN
jgi:hypothetical protein